MKDLIYVLLYFFSINIVTGNNETCGCYMLGTIGNIDGQSLCDDKSLQCKCYPNVVGKDCETCREGYYNILSGKGCIKCNCNALGATNGTCDINTGQCLCKEGFTGFRCDKCMPYSYNFASGGCENCNCNIYGSKDLQCNSKGQCQCIDIAHGPQCEACKENMYNIKQGCKTCPKCYNLIQAASNEYAKVLKNFVKLLDTIQSHPPDKEHQDFLNQLITLQTNITDLQNQSEKVLNSELNINKLNSLLNKTISINNELINLMNDTNNISLKNINTALYEARQHFKSENELVSQCENALKDATTISKNLLRHTKTMTQLAKKSISKANDIENKVSDFLGITANINTTCKEACTATDELQQNLNKLSADLNNIKEEVSNTTIGAKSMQNYVVDFCNKSEVTRQEALKLLNQSRNLEIPPLSVGKNLENLDKDLSVINSTLLNLAKIGREVNNKIDLIEETFNELKNKQIDNDNQFLKFKTAENRATNAVDDINNILKSAKEGLNNLANGYKHIQDEVLTNLKGIPLIQAKIKAVFDHSDDIKLIFKEILNITDEITGIRLNITKILSSIQQGEEITLKHFQEVEEMEKKQEKLAKYLDESSEEIKKIRDSLDSYTKYNNQITLRIQDFEDYLTYLSIFPTTNEELDQIDNEISKSEEMFQTVEQYQNEKIMLEKEVRHVKDILESLPIEELCESAQNEPKTGT